MNDADDVGKSQADEATADPGFRHLLDKLSAELKQVNAKLWDVEDAIRDCEARSDFGEPFIELARMVYRLNDERSRLKKAINLASGSRIVEEKSYRSFQREDCDL